MIRAHFVTLALVLLSSPITAIFGAPVAGDKRTRNNDASPTEHDAEMSHRRGMLPFRGESVPADKRDQVINILEYELGGSSGASEELQTAFGGPSASTTSAADLKHISTMTVAGPSSSSPISSNSSSSLTSHSSTASSLSVAAPADAMTTSAGMKSSSFIAASMTDSSLTLASTISMSGPASPSSGMMASETPSGSSSVSSASAARQATPMATSSTSTSNVSVLTKIVKSVPAVSLAHVTHASPLSSIASSTTMSLKKEKSASFSSSSSQPSTATMTAAPTDPSRPASTDSSKDIGAGLDGPPASSHKWTICTTHCHYTALAHPSSVPSGPAPSATLSMSQPSEEFKGHAGAIASALSQAMIKSAAKAASDFPTVPPLLASASSTSSTSAKDCSSASRKSSASSTPASEATSRPQNASSMASTRSSAAARTTHGGNHAQNTSANASSSSMAATSGSQSTASSASQPMSYTATAGRTVISAETILTPYDTVIVDALVSIGSGAPTMMSSMSSASPSAQTATAAAASTSSVSRSPSSSAAAAVPSSSSALSPVTSSTVAPSVTDEGSDSLDSGSHQDQHGDVMNCADAEEESAEDGKDGSVATKERNSSTGGATSLISAEPRVGLAASFDKSAFEKLHGIVSKQRRFTAPRVGLAAGFNKAEFDRQHRIKQERRSAMNTKQQKPFLSPRGLEEETDVAEDDYELQMADADFEWIYIADRCLLFMAVMAVFMFYKGRFTGRDAVFSSLPWLLLQVGQVFVGDQNIFLISVACIFAAGYQVSQLYLAVRDWRRMNRDLEAQSSVNAPGMQFDDKTSL